MKSNNKTFALFLCLIVATIFSFHYLIAKQILTAGVSPYALSSWRGIIGGGLLLIIFRKRIDASLIKENAKVLLAISFLGFFINQIFFMKGLTLTGPLATSILTNTIPIVTALIAFFFGLESMSKKKALGIIISFAFICFFVFSGNSDNITILNIGNTLIFLNVIAFCTAMILGKKLLTKNFPYELLTASMLLGGGLLMSLIARESMLDMVHYASRGKMELLNILFEIVVSTSIVYLLNIKALSILSATQVSVFIYLQPLITAASDFIFFGNAQRFENFVFFGGILFGAYLVISQKNVKTN